MGVNEFWVKVNTWHNAGDIDFIEHILELITFLPSRNESRRYIGSTIDVYHSTIQGDFSIIIIQFLTFNISIELKFKNNLKY